MAIHTRILAHPSKQWTRMVQMLSPHKNEPSLDKIEHTSRNQSPFHPRRTTPITGKTHPPLTQAQTRHPPTPIPRFLRTRLTSRLPSHQKSQPPRTHQRTSSYHPIHPPTPRPETHHPSKPLKARGPRLDKSSRPWSRSKITGQVHQDFPPKPPLHPPKHPRLLSSAHPQEPPPEERKALAAAHEPWA